MTGMASDPDIPAECWCMHVHHPGLDGLGLSHVVDQQPTRYSSSGKAKSSSDINTGPSYALLITLPYSAVSDRYLITVPLYFHLQMFARQDR